MQRTAIWALLTALSVQCYGLSPGVCQGPINARPVIEERRATLVLKVESYASARDAVLAAAESRGAVVTGGHTEVNGKGKKHGWIDIRAPASQFGRIISDLQPFGKLYADRVTSSDHSSEYEELERRLTQLRQHESRLLKLLDSPRLRGSDILFIQDRVYRAGVDEVLLLQRRADLERMAQQSEIMVEIFEPGTAPGPAPRPFDVASSFSSGMAHAREAIEHAVSRVVTALAFVVVFAPVWIPLLLLVILTVTWFTRRVVPAVIASAEHNLPRLSAALRARLTVLGKELAARRTRQPPGKL